MANMTRQHMNKRQVIEEAVRKMGDHTFTAYDIREICARDYTIRSIGSVLRSIPGIKKVEDGSHIGVSTWQIVA